MVRVRLVEALAAAGHDVIEAERVALYVVGVARPVSNLLKVTTGAGRIRLRVLFGHQRRV